MEENINGRMMIILSRVPSVGLMFSGDAMGNTSKNDIVRVVNLNYYAVTAGASIMVMFELIIRKRVKTSFFALIVV
jgi:hypothetical protein